MKQEPEWLGLDVSAGRALDHPPAAAPANEPGRPAAAQGVVPIRSLSRSHSRIIARHLLALSPEDRYLRFGYAATDEQVRRYVEQIRFERDELLGIFNRRLQLIAMAHLAFSVDPRCLSCAEFGVSVSRSARGRGYGSRLFERAVVHARNEGVQMLFIHALSENTAMLRIARKAGAIIERDGAESEAHLRLPPADFDSRVSEIVDRQVALTDYHLKAQARLFWRVLSGLQSLPQDVLRRLRS
ncbi:MAG TPA: GNAT family N-acetyltransferase [Hydrogenophaga sp.]|uniref:GNAT family N-acetyltransferase n=1 Tax=Hydrogenophaga sp. TaxID=1904254 RepID=UPI002C022165|nr:GNAT family N-acetyltransferase [Hydrogenophaga sp.]HMN92209.1 GNAT family N-acetyltransferase [Hydrogenophaga sp.]